MGLILSLKAASRAGLPAINGLRHVVCRVYSCLCSAVLLKVGSPFVYSYLAGRFGFKLIFRACIWGTVRDAWWVICVGFKVVRVRAAQLCF